MNNQLSSYNTLSHELYEIGQLPGRRQISTSAIRWGDDIIIPSGETDPGISTPGILKIKILRDKKHLNFLDILVITLYFLILAMMGYFFSGRQKNTNDYFKGGGRIPW